MLAWQIAAALFLPGVVIGQRFMRDRKEWSVTAPLVIWNAFMSLFSAYMALGAVGMLIDEWRTHDTLSGLLCDASVYSRDPRSWSIFLFNATKFLEWVDTFFLIVRKRDVITLHWFHHLVTMLYCWHASLYSYPHDAGGVAFCAMNCIVHVIMYGYYAAAALGFRSKYAKLITLLQTSQMVVGIAVCYVIVSTCDGNWYGNRFAVAMYLAYFGMFAQLLLAPRKKKAGKKA